MAAPFVLYRFRYSPILTLLEIPPIQPVMVQPVRSPWGHFPKLVSHSRLSEVNFDRSFEAAKSGDLSAARSLVSRHYTPGQLRPKGRVDFIAAPARISHEGLVSAIPIALALAVAADLGAKFVPSIIQANAFDKLTSDQPVCITRQPIFDGSVPKGSWFIVNDHVSLGSGIANLRGYLMSQGAVVLGATSLTSDLYTANLAPDSSILQTLRSRFHHDLDSTLSEVLGFNSQTLTSREAYFINGLSHINELRNVQAAQRNRISFSQ